MKNLLILLASATLAHALPNGFPEPPLVLYGKVFNTGNLVPLQAYAGALQWTVHPPTGSDFVVTGSLSSISSGVYSYRIEIPAEKVPSTAFVLTAGSIPAGTTTQNSTLSATIDGIATSLLQADGSPHAGIVSFAELLRGKTARIDLGYAGDVSDSDGDGIPDWWETQYGIDPFAPENALADSDGDGVSDLQEYLDGTNPICFEWVKWIAGTGLNLLPLAQRATDADPDGDGVPNILEYALGGDPRTPDADTTRTRVTTSMTTQSGHQHLTVTCSRPGTRHCNVDYLIEASSDLGTWAAVENTDIVTLASVPGQLIVRDASYAGQPGVNRRFLRMRVVYKP